MEFTLFSLSCRYHKEYLIHSIPISILLNSFEELKNGFFVLQWVENCVCFTDFTHTIYPQSITLLLCLLLLLELYKIEPKIADAIKPQKLVDAMANGTLKSVYLFDFFVFDAVSQEL